MQFLKHPFIFLSGYRGLACSLLEIEMIPLRSLLIHDALVQRHRRSSLLGASNLPCRWEMGNCPKCENHILLQLRQGRLFLAEVKDACPWKTSIPTGSHRMRCGLGCRVSDCSSNARCCEMLKVLARSHVPHSQGLLVALPGGRASAADCRGRSLLPSEGVQLSSTAQEVGHRDQLWLPFRAAKVLTL